jgi:tRNA(Ile2)-agmatinylcytidine synthase
LTDTRTYQFRLFKGTETRRLVEIGLDDTDSRTGMCTTFIAHRLVERLLNMGTTVEDYPRLIRLNPNIPWKTRGNGAVALRLGTEDVDTVFRVTCDTVEQYSETGKGADPGVVASTYETAPQDIKKFAKRAISELVTRKEAVHLMEKHDMRFKGWGKQRGLIGALAAIGSHEMNDQTFELIAFRVEENWVVKRKVSHSSVWNMSIKTKPYTFNSFDDEKNRVLITPRGHDPVLLGIRGENPKTLHSAYRMVKVGEDVSGYMIFKTNQGTGAHLEPELDPSTLKAYRSGHLKGTVSKKPWTGRGGHVYLEAENGRGTFTCAAYEPTGNFRKAVLQLIPGDLVEMGGSIRKKSRKHGAVINLEYLNVMELATDTLVSNPLCHSCGKRMTSQGQGQGYRCDTCGFKDPAAKKIAIEKPRVIQRGVYLPPPRAQRHLTRPLHRYHYNNRGITKLINGWFEPKSLTADPRLK